MTVDDGVARGLVFETCVVYDFFKHSLLFFVEKMGQTHEVAITIKPAFPRALLSRNLSFH